MFIYYTSGRQWNKIVSILNKNPTLYYQDIFSGKKNVIELDEDEYKLVISQWPSYMAKIKVAKNIDTNKILKMLVRRIT